MNRQCNLICKAESAELVGEKGAGWGSAWQREESREGQVSLFRRALNSK